MTASRPHPRPRPGRDRSSTIGRPKVHAPDAVQVTAVMPAADVTWIDALRTRHGIASRAETIRAVVRAARLAGMDLDDDDEVV